MWRLLLNLDRSNTFDLFTQVRRCAAPFTVTACSFVRWSRFRWSHAKKCNMHSPCRDNANLQRNTLLPTRALGKWSRVDPIGSHLQSSQTRLVWNCVLYEEEPSQHLHGGKNFEVHVTIPLVIFFTEQFPAIIFFHVESCESAPSRPVTFA